MADVTTTVAGYRVESGGVSARVFRDEMDDAWVVRVFGASIFVPLVNFLSEQVAIQRAEMVVDVLAEERGLERTSRERARTAVEEFRGAGR